MSGIREEALEEIEVNQIIEHTTLGHDRRVSLVSEAKRSFSESRGKNSSSKTIFSIVNTMVGSSVVVFGFHFQNVGLISSLVTAILIGIISYKTCSIQLKHFKLEETDLPDSIDRILGRKWYLLYISSSFFLLFLVGIIYFSLNMNMFYESICFIIKKINGEILPSVGEIEFSKFSYQYAGIIGISFQLVLFNIKNLKFIIKLSVLGIFAVVSFIIYSIYKAFDNYENLSEVKLYEENPLNYILLLGIYSLSFFVHNVILPIMKNNQNSEKNERDLGLGFFFTGLVFVLLGSFGALALAGKDLSNKNTFFDFFEPDWIIVILRIMLWIQLQTVLPILWYVSRTHFFNIFYNLEAPPKYQIHLANIFFALTCYLVQAFNVNPSLLISIAGSIGGFTLMYILPIKLHLDCLKMTMIMDSNQAFLEKEDKIIADTYIESSAPVKLSCKSFHEGMLNSISMTKRKIIYSFITLFGIAVMIAQIMNIFIK